MAQIALAWMLTKPGVTAPIIGTTKLANLEDILGRFPFLPIAYGCSVARC